MKPSTLISIKNCRIDNTKKTLIPNLNWTLNSGENWLVIGPNGGGKADFLNAIANQTGFKILPNNAEQESYYTNIFSDSTEIVSLERAARLIQEERENDESEYVEGGVDIGRTGRVFIAEGVAGTIKKNSQLPQFAKDLDNRTEVKLCGITKILDRGLKYMSTGEIRRTLLTRALISGKKLLLLSDPFAGLDIESRTILLEFVNKLTSNTDEISNSYAPVVILSMERWHEIPDSITNVLEFTNKEISFCGSRTDYEKILSERTKNDSNKEEIKEQFKNDLENLISEETVSSASPSTSNSQTDKSSNTDDRITLVEMNNVNVGWDGNQVLKNLTWKLTKGEHWLIRGPNGSGKTTFLELITGDNMQVFCNDVRIFGNRRGSGESIWDIKKRLGIVSYRMHVEYRMLGGTSLMNVIISGFRDSIGLYGAATDIEIATAKKWLKLGGFENRENESFGNLSYGEQRAILILRSAVKSPEILILDEPCHGLDENFRNKILNLMNLIGEGGTTTMLHVTHDPSEVLPCEKHILELHPGEEPMYQIKQSS